MSANGTTPHVEMREMLEERLTEETRELMLRAIREGGTLDQGYVLLVQLGSADAVHRSHEYNGVPATLGRGATPAKSLENFRWWLIDEANVVDGVREKQFGGPFCPCWAGLDHDELVDILYRSWCYVQWSSALAQYNAQNPVSLLVVVSEDAHGRFKARDLSKHVFQTPLDMVYRHWFRFSIR